MMLPVWWDGENVTDPALTMDPNQIEGIMEIVQQYYVDMSWGKMNLTWGMMPQQVLTGQTAAAPDFNPTAEAARAIVSAQYTKGVDYDGIALVYFSANSGPFSGGGGWAGVNGDFMWMSYEMGFAVTRHEVG